MLKETSKSEKNKEHIKYYKKSNKLIAFFVVLFAIIIFFIYSYNKVSPIFYEDIQIILDNKNVTEILQNAVVKENGHIYMSTEDVKQFLDETIYIEEETNTIITTSFRKLAAIKNGEDKININGSYQNVIKPIIEVNDKKYIAISEMENVYDYELKYIENSNIVIIDNLNKKQTVGYLKKATKLKEKADAFSKNIEKLSKGSKVVILQEEGNKTKVRTESGFIGYIKNNKIENIENVRENFVETTSEQENANYYEYDLTNKDITTFEKRQEIINIILQQAIKNDKMYIKIKYNNDKNNDYNRFKIEAVPMLKECGINMSLYEE